MVNGLLADINVQGQVRILHYLWMSSRAYAERVVIKALEYLLEIDNVRGAGRLYLPGSPRTASKSTS